MNVILTTLRIATMEVLVKSTQTQEHQYARAQILIF